MCDSLHAADLSPTDAAAVVAPMRFAGRRSPVYARHGMVASSQPLASDAGLQILRAGGNAADAAVAVAAALAVTEPASTGLGGDCFCLYYDAATKSVQGLNGSGRAPRALGVANCGAKPGAAKLKWNSVHACTVPGAVAGWIDTLEQFGTQSPAQVLQPAIDLAGGFPVAPVTARLWKQQQGLLQKARNGSTLLGRSGAAPQAGELLVMPEMQSVLRDIAAHGRDGFYAGRVAKSIVDRLALDGGLMTLEDLASHRSQRVEPQHVQYRGVDVYELPPNGQGITALMALNMLEEIRAGGHDFCAEGPNSGPHVHAMIEALRIAFADSKWHVADPDAVDIPLRGLLSRDYARQRASALFDPARAVADPQRGQPATSTDTVYFSVVDKDGNACSFINSTYFPFGGGFIPDGCGFALQNRGANFSLEEGHPNQLAGGKRPYHTIIPGMALRDGKFWASFGCMGGFMQPQGHVQLLSHMLDFGIDPQSALDMPRFCLTDGTSFPPGHVAIEEGMPADTVAALEAKGHRLVHVDGDGRFLFGRGQIILQDADSKVLAGGCDPRSDGVVAAY